MNAAPEPLTLTAGDITRARRLAVLLTVNSLALAVLNDRRDELETAARPAPYSTPRPKGGLTTADYLQAHQEWEQACAAARAARAVMVEAAYRLRDAERYTPAIVPELLAARAVAERKHGRAEDRRRALEVDLRCVTQAIRNDLAPRVRPGHLTAYRVRLPTVQYVSPTFGLHALSEPHTATVDTAGLEGDDLAYFLDFMRTFPARGRWPLYAPDARDGLQAMKNHLLARPMRRILEALILAHPGSVPTVHPVEVALGVLPTD